MYIKTGPLELACQELFNHSDLKTWLSEWQIENKRLSPIQCQAIMSKSTNLLQQVEDVEKDLSFTLPSYFSSLTNDEWLGTFVFPIKHRLNEIINKANNVFSPYPTPAILPSS